MNEKQFSDRIGNVNDKLIRQAEQIPNYRRGHRRRSIRQLATIAAVIALMVCSFSVGALAFAEKIYVSLSSLCSWDYERYKDCYVPIYGNEILKSELPMSAQLVGETVFVGYHMPVTDELETNAFREPVPVYKDNTDNQNQINYERGLKQ